MGWLSGLKAFSDTIVYVFLIGIATSMITSKFYPIMAVLLVPGLISSVIYLMKKVLTKKE